MKKITTLTFLLFSSMVLFSQQLTPEVVASAGDVFQGENVILSWTIGETVIETFTDGESTLTQGFHQSYYTILPVEEDLTSGFSISVYPNPAREFINLHIQADKMIEPVKLRIELIDNLGNLVYTSESSLSTQDEKIYLNGYQTNLFYLRILDPKGKLVNSFKILKVRF